MMMAKAAKFFRVAMGTAFCLGGIVVAIYRDTQVGIAAAIFFGLGLAVELGLVWLDRQPLRVRPNSEWHWTRRSTPLSVQAPGRALSRADIVGKTLEEVACEDLSEPGLDAIRVVFILSDGAAFELSREPSELVTCPVSEEAKVIAGARTTHFLGQVIDDVLRLETEPNFEEGAFLRLATGWSLSVVHAAPQGLAFAGLHAHEPGAQGLEPVQSIWVPS